MVASIENQEPDLAGAMEAASSEGSKSPKAPKAKKKGNRSWRPAAPLALKAKDSSFRMKWGHTDPARMMRARAEGWEPADPGDAIHDRPSGVDAGKGTPAGVVEYRDMVLLKMPEELARERDAYYREAAMNQLNAIKTRAKKEIRQQTGVSVEGSVTIE